LHRNRYVVSIYIRIIFHIRIAFKITIYAIFEINDSDMPAFRLQFRLVKSPFETRERSHGNFRSSSVSRGHSNESENHLSWSLNASSTISLLYLLISRVHPRAHPSRSDIFI